MQHTVLPILQITQQLVILTVAVEFVIKFAGIYARTDEGEGTFVTEQDTLQTPTDNGSAGLGGLKIAQLQTLASQLGITGTSRMRKAQLVEVIADHQRGGSDTARQAVEEAKAAAAKERKSRGNAAKTKDAEQPAEQASTKEAPAESKNIQQDSQDQQGKDNTSKNRNQQSRDNKSSRQNGSNDNKSSRDQQQPSRDEKKSQQDTSRDDQQQSKQHDADDSDEHQGGRGQRTRNQQRRDQGRNRKEQHDQHDKRDQQQDNSDDSGDDNRDGNRRRRDDDQRNQRRQRQRDRNRSRDRRRDHDQDHDDQQDVSDDEALLPVSGILDVLDNYAFVRTSGYLPGPNDVYVSMAMVKRFGLRKGDAIRGQVRAPQDDNDNQQNQNNQGGGGGGGRGGRGGRNRRGGGGGGGGGNRQKFNALVNLDLINGQEPVENPKRVEFNKLTPLYPQERLRLENNSNPKDMGPRLVDLVAPIGKGQRGLIVSPPKAGKTMMLQSIANAITTNNPEVKLMMVLVDERPEEVTDMKRSVRGEVIASTFDRPAEDHTTVAELTIERAKRMVELGHDVVVLLDSMTRLGRAYNLTSPASGRILSGGVDSAALYPPKKFFGAARNIEGGGSLTILATALVETGSRMDEVIFEEFKGTGNMELRLSRELSERRIFPAIDINASGTRREENLLTTEEIRIMWRLRRVLSELKTQQGLELLTSKLKETETNAEFLMLVSKTTLRAQTES